jgi:DNA-binding transcriptional LysR family regulator
MKDRPSIDFLRALEGFVAIADSGSMTKAAGLLRITQSAISQQLKQLETELGVELIDRSGRPLLLTPAGLSLRQRAKEMLQEADRIRADLRQASSGPLAQLRIAMFSTLAPTLVPAILREVTGGALPARSISMMRGITAYSGRELLQREVDVVITSNALYDLEGLERHELISERFILAVPETLEVKDVSLRSLAGRLPLIRYASRTEAGRLVEAHLRRQRLRGDAAFSFDSPEDLMTAVGLGHGWAIIAPTHAIHAGISGEHVRLMQMPKPGIGRNITLVARIGELGDAPARLADICRRALVRHYLPRARAVLGELAGEISIVGAAAQAEAAPAHSEQ